MGRGKRGGRRGRGGRRDNGTRDNRKQEPERNERGAGYSAVKMENAALEKYYKEGGLLSSEEWEEFWEILKKPLPTTFRFTGSRSHALQVLESLKTLHIPHLQGLTFEGEPVETPRPLEWYPENLAWQVNVGKQTIRRCPPYKKFQQFLVAETSIGNISRQEAVSMIPPMFLDIKPHHKVLDMCAAPGSKTAQLVEMLHGSEEVDIKESLRKHKEGIADPHDDYGRPTGVIVANDVDYKRAHLLVHQTKRLNSPNIIITNNDATAFPSLIESPGNPSTHAKKTYIKFDRILADVPCTGDGTPRKNYSVWKDWKPMNAMSLHSTQLKILIRGIQLLKPGGRIVYSTCSMNPVENEAVVAAAIEASGGTSKVQVVDVSDHLPMLKRRPGLKGGWKLMSNGGQWWSSLEDIENSEEGRRIDKKKYQKSWFYNPPEDEEQRPKLERTLRVYPHLQDSGGFYIAVLEKLDTSNSCSPKEAVEAEAKLVTTPAEDVQMTEAPRQLDGLVTPHPHHPEPTCPPSPGKRKYEGTELPFEPPRKKLDLDEGTATPTPTHHHGTELPPPDLSAVEPDAKDVTEPVKEAPKQIGTVAPKQKKKTGERTDEFFVYLDPNHEALESVKSFYEINAEFPMDRFLVRNAEGIPARAIYYTNALAKLILQNNDPLKCSVRFVHAGVKMFVKQDTQDAKTCIWRIQNEGLPILDGWLGDRRVVYAKKRSTVFALLIELFPKEDSVEEIREQVAKLQMGCAVLRIIPSQGEDGFEHPMTLPLWKSRHSINLMFPKEERKEMLSRVFDYHEEIIDSTKKNSQQQDAKNEEEAVGMQVDDLDPADFDELAEAKMKAEDDEDDDGGVLLPKKEDVEETEAKTNVAQE